MHKAECDSSEKTYETYMVLENGVCRLEIKFLQGTFFLYNEMSLIARLLTRIHQTDVALSQNL